jgi:hypothetical protein
VSRRIESWTLIALMAILSSVPTLAAEDVPLHKDLTAVIALLALPCGRVVSVTPLKDNDHIATCQDGNRYRVYMDAQGRVVAQKQ